MGNWKYKSSGWRSPRNHQTISSLMDVGLGWSDLRESGQTAWYRKGVGSFLETERKALKESNVGACKRVLTKTSYCFSGKKRSRVSTHRSCFSPGRSGSSWSGSREEKRKERVTGSWVLGFPTGWNLGHFGSEKMSIKCRYFSAEMKSDGPHGNWNSRLLMERTDVEEMHFRVLLLHQMHERPQFHIKPMLFLRKWVTQACPKNFEFPFPKFP